MIKKAMGKGRKESRSENGSYGLMSRGKAIRLVLCRWRCIGGGLIMFGRRGWICFWVFEWRGDGGWGGMGWDVLVVLG